MPVTVYIQVGDATVAGGAPVPDAKVAVGLELTVAKLFLVVNKETIG